ncbi:M24 family metallopeptidase [Chloroflexota bacterium]
MKISNRLQKIRQKLIEKEIEAILISQPENRYYLSGFDGSAGFLLITPQRTILATDFRYIEQAKTQAPAYEIFPITNAVAKWFPELITGLNPKQLGFEALHVTFDLHQQLINILNKENSRLKLVPTNGLVESLRAVKEPEEIKLITKAVKISDSAFEHVENILYIGISEKEIAWELDKFMREKGSQPMPFEIIVASGPNAALPHHKPSQRTVQSGEPLIIDMGARVGAYISDLTRTICLDNCNDTFNKVYNIVLGAQLEAITQIKEGMSGGNIDHLSRVVIEQAGYGTAFGHGLGHGIGLAPHESPRLGLNSTEIITSGMVFTVEPGIYLAGWGGVRIEDTVVLESGKIRVLSKARKMHDR